MGKIWRRRGGESVEYSKVVNLKTIMMKFTYSMFFAYEFLLKYFKKTIEMKSNQKISFLDDF